MGFRRIPLLIGPIAARIVPGHMLLSSNCARRVTKRFCRAHKNKKSTTPSALIHGCDPTDVPEFFVGSPSPRKKKKKKKSCRHFPRCNDTAVFIHSHYQSRRPRLPCQNFRRRDNRRAIKFELMMELVNRPAHPFPGKIVTPAS